MNSQDGTFETIINPNEEIIQNSYLKTFDEYRQMYNKSIEDPDQFWSDISNEFYWKKPHSSVLDANFNIEEGNIFVHFMKGALTNACYNVLDRNIERGMGDNVAYHWEGNDGIAKRRITYTELRREVCKFANALKGQGVKIGDRVLIYMPVSIECVVAMLACARIGAVHVIVFAGFSAESLAERIIDAKCNLLISADGFYRANKLVPLKIMSDSAITICRQRGYLNITNIIKKHKKTNNKSLEKECSFAWNDQLDICWDEFIKNESDSCEPVWVDSEAPLFILYTSGSTGKPKSILHTTAGYLLQSYLVVKYVYDIMPGDVLFSTADLGWAVGHFISIYGGLANVASNVILEGTPTHPSPDRLWDIVDRLKVKGLITAPTVLRNLMKFGDHYVKAHKRTSLKVLGIAGETIDPKAWLWYWKIVGDRRCSIVDLYGQTENGVPMFSSLPGCTPMKPGSTSLPLFGTLPAILDENGNEIIGPGEGHLVFKRPWPAIARTILNNHTLFESSYFQKFPGYFYTSDAVLRDEDGYYWIKGRIDETMNVSGHLLSAIEIEAAIIEHDAVSEAGVVAHPHSEKGDIPIVFIILNDGFSMTVELEKDLKRKVRERIGPFAQPDLILAVSDLPKNRNGKIMRKILKLLIQNKPNLGDTSTMINESVLDEFKVFKKLFI